MTQVMVAFFNSEPKAVQAVKKLRDLELYGIITVYDRIMIQKKTGGGYEIVKEDIAVDYPVVDGMQPGKLYGPAGFVAGAVVGAAAAVNYYNFEEDFIESVVKKMAADKVLVIVETDALTEEFMDAYVRSFDAIVIKTAVGIPPYGLFSREMKESQAAIESAARELKKGKNRQVIQAQLIHLKAVRKELFTAFEVPMTAPPVAS